MRKRIVRWASVLLVLGGLLALFNVPAAAATPALTIKTMKISVWPEYDDPRVFVSYQGAFNDSSAFPQEVGFPAPNGVDINMVCALQPPDNNHLCQLYTTASDGDAMDINYKLPIPTYYLEYYWDGLKTGASGNKSLSFSYKSPYQIGTLTVSLEQPARATAFTTSPSGATMVTDSDGLNDYEYTYKNVQPGQVITVGASYVKPDNKPSFTKSQTSGAATSGDSSSGGRLGYGWVFALAGVAALAGGFFVFRRRPAPAGRARSRRVARAESRRAGRHRPQPVPVHQASRKAAAPGRTTAPPPSDTAGFCPYCGTRLASGAGFCHACGAEMKGLG